MCFYDRVQVKSLNAWMIHGSVLSGLRNKQKSDYFDNDCHVQRLDWKWVNAKRKTLKSLQIVWRAVIQKMKRKYGSLKRKYKEMKAGSAVLHSRVS